MFDFFYKFFFSGIMRLLVYIKLLCKPSLAFGDFLSNLMDDGRQEYLKPLHRNKAISGERHKKLLCYHDIGRQQT